MTFPVSKEARANVQSLLQDESLTPQERVLLEGLSDGTFRLTPDGFLITSEGEPQPSPIEEDPVLEAQQRRRQYLSDQAPGATEEFLDWLECQ